MNPRQVIGAAPALMVALAVALAACGDDDGGDGDTPSGVTTPPSPGLLPPELLECFADEGFDLESPDDLHSAPPDVVERCFTEFHQGGA